MQKITPFLWFDTEAEEAAYRSNREVATSPRRVARAEDIATLKRAHAGQS